MKNVRAEPEGLLVAQLVLQKFGEPQRIYSTLMDIAIT